jgi:hypothetical protein
MAAGISIPDLERVTFYDGQRLTAHDLSEAQRALRELRWLHNRSLHAWGIAFGLSVSGQKGDTQVTVSPGYALDCHGREIVLTEPRRLLVPPVAENVRGEEPSPAFYLTIAYPEDDQLVLREHRDGACGANGATRLAETPGIHWLQAHRHGLDVVLAQAWVENCRLDRALSFRERRSARPPRQPHIASGETDANGTVWTQVSVTTTAGVEERIGFATKVDTSAAGFQSTPAYQAHVVGQGVKSEPGRRYVVAGIPQIRAARQDSFELLVVMPQGFILGEGGIALNPADALEAGELNWRVVWMGVEE